MLEELLKLDKIGSKEELLFFLFDGLPCDESQPLIDLQKYCVSHVFSIAKSFPGIVKFCELISFVQVSDGKLSVNKTRFDSKAFQRESYFSEYHMFDYLIRSLEQLNVIGEIFNENNLKFNTKLNRYYVLDSKFPYRFFPIRNLLLTTGFLEREADYSNHLLVKHEFTHQFKKGVVDRIPRRVTKKKLSLEELKRILDTKEKVGREAELRVLQYEHERLRGHSEIRKICLLSDEYVNAGYDIESFDDRDSIVLDRFIEVKSYEGKLSFYWSRGEVEKAKELGEKYFIYLVDRAMFNESTYQPRKFQNPYKKIFESELWLKETSTWKMTFRDSPVD